MVRPERFGWVYVYFTDLLGGFRRFLMSARLLDDRAYSEGLGKLDGSSVPGFASIEESDLVLKPDPATLMPYPWCGDLCEEGVARVIADVYLRGGRERHPVDPRGALARAMELLGGEGLEALVSAELEYFLFDEVQVVLEPFLQAVRFESEEGYWSSDPSTMSRRKDGYYAPSHRDVYEDFKHSLLRLLRDTYGIEAEVSHHEVASAGQQEINTPPASPMEVADRLQLLKEAIRVEALNSGLTATFMPKPLTGENGNGLHVHVSIWRGGENMFYSQDDPYGLSGYARSFIAGILEHGRALSAIVSPTVNSYKRLMPGYEAPIYLVWGASNRSAAIRIPLYHVTPGKARLEYRSPDPTMNPYLGLSAIILAGLDGVRRKLDPGDPVEENVYRMSPERRRSLGIRQLPRSLDEALDELETDHQWLLQAWPRELLERYIDLKREEARRVNEWVSPAEIYHYYDA